jgi:hypothetical protein
MTKFDIPYVPKIEVPRFDISPALAEEIARISEQDASAEAQRTWDRPL